MLYGSQQPRICVRPPSTSSSGPEVADLCESVGLMLDPWQRYCLDVIHAEAGGRWAAFEAGLIVPRQNGKGSVLVAVELGALFLFGEQLVLHSSHEFKTSAEGFRRLLSYVEGSDDLRRRVGKVRTSHGEEGIELLSGQRIRFVARSTGSGRGFTADRAILDEAYNLGPAQMAALLPTLSARPDPQILYTSSAPMASSAQLHDVRRRALAGTSARLALLEWSIDPDVDDEDDPAAWAKANPALGIRVPAGFVQAERDALPSAEFRRERLGVPDAPAGEQPPLFGVGCWEGCLQAGSRVAGRVWFGVEISHDRQAASIAVTDGTHVELVDRRAGVDWLAGRVAELVSRHRPVGVVVDPSGPAGPVVDGLAAVPGIRLVEVSGGEVAAACGRMFDLVTGQKVRHIGQPDLDLAVGAARRRPRGDAFVWDRRGELDVSPLVAVTLAVWVASGRAAPARAPIVVFA